MRPLMLAMLMALLAGCSGVDQDITHMQEQQDALSAAIKKIRVSPSASLKGNPQYAALGRVEGYCFNAPNSTGGQVVHGDGLKAAAYRKYGDQVDAIVNTSIWFVSDDSYGGFEPFTENGYFECAGTAVHFTEAVTAPPATKQGEPSL
jgi:hypothetical protein